jgi:hypothetical protein
MSATNRKAARATTPGTASKSLSTPLYFTALSRAWVAIVSVAQRLAIDGLMLATSVPLLAVLVAVLGAPK